MNEAIKILGKDLEFPNPSISPSKSPLAIGGDLSVERLCKAYYEGIFSWFEDGVPPLRGSRIPRCVILPSEYRVNKTLRRYIRRYRVELNKDFDTLVGLCAKREQTWITNEMRQAYGKMHQEGLAHCVSVYEDETLVGGVYGVSVGGIFCGESMVSLAPNASKVSLWALIYKFSRNLALIDCQVPNPHLLSLGARVIHRDDFLKILKARRDEPCPLGVFE